ncbi:MAG: hypothetical protein JSV52_03820 [Candidatus Zixiibacteriota bacterium]|nr:MAG: hypothetical protein JSV52_03820 [candidate division Zixibacteria bacterium]
MRKIVRLSVFGFILSVLVISHAFSDDGLALMKVEHGARPAGMGTAFVTVVNDPNAPGYNPASITDLAGFTISFGHTSYWENVRLESGFFVKSLSRRVFLHGGLRFAVVDEIEQRMFPTEEPENYFDAHDISMKSGVSYRVTDKLNLGLSVGWFIEKIEAWRGTAFNIDLGALYLPEKNLALGASVTNLGSAFSLSKSGVEGSREISLPTTYTAGASYRYDRYLGVADIVILDDDVHLHLGAEAEVHEMFDVRAGYMFNYDSKNITAGVSFTKRNIAVDYAFVPYSNDLGTSHLFNFTVRL